MTESVPAVEVPTKWVKFKRSCRRAIGVISWIFPFVIMMVGLALFPPLSTPVGQAVGMEVFFGLFCQLLLTVIWVITELYYAANRDTSVRQLQVDVFVSSLFAVGLSMVGVFFLTVQMLPYWYMLPWAGSIADMFGSGFFAINNSAQKPLVQNETRK